jgi:hypothetical protein
VSEPRNILSILTSADGQNRILVAQRQDGVFGLVHERSYRSEHEGEFISEGWISMTAISSFYADIAAAEAGAAEWLRILDGPQPLPETSI